MEIKPIRNTKDHDRTLREIEKLWGCAKGSAQGDRLDVLVALVEASVRSAERRPRPFAGYDSPAPQAFWDSSRCAHTADREEEARGVSDAWEGFRFPFTLLPSAPPA